MSFQILNSQGVAIPINDLDKEVCEFWGKEYSEKNYANPYIEREDGSTPYLKDNWFDAIGWSTHASKANTWGQALQYFANIYEMDIVSACKIDENHYLYPYIQLFQYWQQKGYTPQFID